MIQVAGVPAYPILKTGGVIRSLWNLIRYASSLASRQSCSARFSSRPAFCTAKRLRKSRSVPPKRKPGASSTKPSRAEKAKSATLPDILVVGIAGGSGGGKTTLTTNLIRRFGDKVCIVHHDNYYRAHDDLTYEERTKLNYDCPEAFETEMMIEHLRLLKQGRSIHCPVYDFKVHNRSGETIEIEPRPVILVEGILIFADPALSDLMDIRVFVDADADVRLARRVLRDTEKRGRTVRSVVEQWQNTVKPMHEKYVEPSKKNADIIVPQGGKNPVALDLIVGRIQRHLDENA